MARKAKRTTRKAAHVVADRIEKPHGGNKVKKVGAQTGVEAHRLSGASGPRGGSVRQVGPSSLRSTGSSASVRRVGEANFEDRYAVEGLGTPYARQAGSVKQIGPADTGYAALTQTASGGAGTAKSGRVLRSNRIIHDTTLLKSGVGRAHDWSKYAGQPGTKKGQGAGVGGSVLINGRKRRFGTESDGPAQVEPTGPTIA